MELSGSVVAGDARKSLRQVARTLATDPSAPLKDAPSLGSRMVGMAVRGLSVMFLIQRTALTRTCRCSG